MDVASVFSAITPPSASTSRTICPLAWPPIAGLHDIWPIESRFCVSMIVRHPNRAEAEAASIPACPAPITITSYAVGWVNICCSTWNSSRPEDAFLGARKQFAERSFISLFLKIGGADLQRISEFCQYLPARPAG